ncbi:MAG: protein kinase, partial [bacterium]
QRFIHEAKTASALDHPNICNIHEIDETEDGQMFITMAYYEGETLNDKIAGQPLELEEALDLALQTAEGLARAHEKGIVHRDLKPANLLLTREGVVKILDFGLAKSQNQIKLTKAGTTLGTAAYMSPEQARGEEVDARTDIFSFGVILYEMLTGELPFKGDYEQALTYAILNEAHAPLSAVRPGLPEELERIIDKCLQKEAPARYPNATELLADLKALSGFEAVSGLRKPKSQNLAKVVNLRKVAFAGMAAVILLSLGYYFFMDRETAGPTERVPIAVVDFVNQTNEPELNGLSGMLITSLEQSRRLDVMSRARMFDELKKMGKTDLSFVDEPTGREIAKQANLSALAVATIRKLGQIYTIDFKVIDPESGEHLFTAREQGKGQESILGMIDRLSEKTRIDLREEQKLVQFSSRGVGDVTTTNLEAYQHYFLGEQLMNKLRHKEAQEEYRKALALDSTFALAWYRLAYAINWQVGSTSLTMKPLQKALALSHRLPEKEKYLLRALAARVEGGQAATLPVLKEMEKIYPNEKEMLYEIGDYAFHANQHSTAIHFLNKVLVMDPTHERALMHLAMTHRATGEYEKIQPVLERLATVNQKEAYVQAGETELSLGHYDGAVDYFNKAYEIDSTDHQTLFDFVRAYNAAGQYDQALRFSNRMVTRHGSPLAYICLAWTYEWSGDLDNALQACQNGLQHFPNDHALQAGIGQLYAMQGEYDRAEAHFKAMTKAPRERLRREGFRQLAGFYPYLGKYAEMMRMFDKGIEFARSDNDSNSVARQTAAKAYWMFWGRGNKQEALAEIAKVAGFRNVTDDVYYWSLALLYAEIGDMEKAVTAAKLTVDPSWKLAAEASIHAAKQEWQQAINKLERLGRLRPAYQPLSRYQAAQYYFAMREYDKAVAEIAKSQRFYDAGRQGYYGSGRHAFAYPLGFHLLGKIYENKGDKQRAIENTEKFLDLWRDADPELPDLIDAKKRLARLKGTSSK